MFYTLDAFLKKALPLLAPFALLSGLLMEEFLSVFRWIIPWLFALMAFSASLSFQVDEIKHTINHIHVYLINSAILHVILQTLIRLLSLHLFTDKDIITAFAIVSLAPIGTSSLLWVSFFKGSISVALAMVILDTLLIPFIFPVMLELFTHSLITINSWQILRSLIYIVLLPSIIAIIMNHCSKGAIQKHCSFSLALLSKLSILLILFISGNISSLHFQEVTWDLASILIFLLIICCAGYITSYATGRFFFKKNADIIAFTICGGLKNVGMGLAISVLYFPPLTSFIVALGMIFQQILGYIAGRAVSAHLSR